MCRSERSEESRERKGRILDLRDSSLRCAPLRMTTEYKKKLYAYHNHTIFTLRF